MISLHKSCNHGIMRYRITKWMIALIRAGQKRNPLRVFSRYI